jgi:cyclopropane fatty-acyl-phospholipid synthase-like methyltransferase
VLTNIRKHIDPLYSPRKALDFGCGVGRLVIPLARIADHVTGVDVSQSMIDEAKRNCESRSIQNVEFIKSENNVLSLDGKYDFINSVLVFQHIPVRRGEYIFENLLAHLADGGVCAVHFTYTSPWVTRQWMRDHIPFAHNLFNAIKCRKLYAPQMQMNPYSMNHIFCLMQKYNINEFYAELIRGGVFLSIMLYFMKPAKV